MRIKQLVQHRVSTGASGESLRPLSRQEIQQVAGGYYIDLFDEPPQLGEPGGPGGPTL